MTSVEREKFEVLQRQAKLLRETWLARAGRAAGGRARGQRRDQEALGRIQLHGCHGPSKIG
jgi:hypothetical protein